MKAAVWSWALLGSPLMVGRLTSLLSKAQVGAKPTPPPRSAAARPEPLPLGVFTAVTGDGETKALAALARIERQWDDSSLAMLIETVHFAASRRVLAQLPDLIAKRSRRRA